MKMLTCSLGISLMALAGPTKAEPIITVDGIEYPVSVLIENCKSISSEPEVQLVCFNSLSKLIDEQAGGTQAGGASATEALDALRAVADYQSDSSGLSVLGSSCTVQFIYFDNYFHISRRNISSIDLYSAQFDASKLLFEQTAASKGAQSLLSKGFMSDGATARTVGGVALESAALGFEPKSPRATTSDYATEVVAQLQASENQSFDFVLVHPERADASAEIWAAFENFVSACQG